jgi:hypothetical protein
MSALCRSLLALMAVSLLPLHVTALPSPQAIPSGMGKEDSGAPPLDLTTPTPFQQFVNRLRLDTRSQLPAAQETFSAALKEAAPVGQEMLQLRQQLVSLALANRRDDEMKQVVDAYAVAAARMTGIETRAFASVYRTLKPNQQSGASQAFAFIAGMFHPSAPRGGGGRSER